MVREELAAAAAAGGATERRALGALGAAIEGRDLVLLRFSLNGFRRKLWR